MTISISSQSMEVLLFFWLLLRRDFIPLYPMLILFSHVASAVTMDYMSVLKQI
ncbi:hypothetical protein T4D_13461 [Trichinella pseudospiralis]|uniref:Uncharacterized protein n=1 Tax=Trichinella pseudospiralis TaxID=6337 RepID=A0A0V1F3B8_TRIPS|nr:hypothetical protein T4D_7142 [Trichinella pseudospiralis]KRY80648.1 hypothetical protein T4D_12868 [Trichinella pseudospiralis]KRY80650.1 hypothetical protein T4D_10562 [Trichinella pseudospiralis]KRY80672.1 hypothetical protein T4D_13461 [Trichinella pseudospiralis]